MGRIAHYSLIGRKMKVLVAGSSSWNNYQEVVRKMTVVLDEWVRSNPEDKRIIFVHSGNQGAENMVTEYIGKVEKLIRQKGYSISEKVVSTKKFSTEDNPRQARDYHMISEGADVALVFSKDSDYRVRNFTNLVEAFGIPFEVIKD